MMPHGGNLRGFFVVRLYETKTHQAIGLVCFGLVETWGLEPFAYMCESLYYQGF